MIRVESKRITFWQHAEIIEGNFMVFGGGMGIIVYYVLVL